MKERVGSSARNGDGEGGTNDVHATSIFGSRLGLQTGSVANPSDMASLPTLRLSRTKTCITTTSTFRQ